MKAMQYQAYGGPEQLRVAEVARPVPSASQLLVKVLATSVNPVDWKLHGGGYRWLMPVKFPSTPGLDLAGEVVAVGVAVTRFKVGDRVFAMADTRPGGACAEYAVIGEAVAAPLPHNLSVHEAAAIPLAGLTALQALRDLGHIDAGQRVLVVGASGGVGHLAVQLARAFGARVTAVTSSRNVALVRSLGADSVIDYTRQRGFATEAPYQLIFDAVVSSPLRQFLPVLARDGVYVSVLPSFARLAAAVLLPLYTRRRVRIVSVRSGGTDLERLRTLAEEGKLRPVIGRTYPLDALAEAHASSRGGHAAGKIVISVAEAT